MYGPSCPRAQLSGNRLTIISILISIYVESRGQVIPDRLLIFDVVMQCTTTIISETLCYGPLYIIFSSLTQCSTPQNTILLFCSVLNFIYTLWEFKEHIVPFKSRYIIK